MPYGMDGGLPGSSSSAGGLPSPAGGSDGAAPGVQFSPIKAEKAPDGATSLTVDGATIAAPAGRMFKWFLKADYDGDGNVDVAAWVQPAVGPGGEVLWAQRKAPNAFAAPVTCTTAPASLSVPAGCTLEAELAQVGPRTASITLNSVCADRPGQPRPRWVAAVMPTRQPATRLELTLESPASDEVTVQIDGADRDGDQLDDVTAFLTVSNDAPPFESAGGPVAAELHWFDRPAGLSRDPHEPDASMRANVSRLQKLAKKKGSLAEVASGARKLHRLQEMLCEDGGSPSIRVQGLAVQCGASGAVADADLAEIEAALKSNEPLAAIATEDRMERESSVLDARKLAEARSRLEKMGPWQTANVAELPATPLLSPSDTPGWGALSFGADGALLVRESAGVRRFEPDSKTSTGPTPASWPVAVTSPDSKATFAKVMDPCDGSPLRAKLTVQGAGDKELLLPVSSPLGKLCARAPIQPSAQALSWSPIGLEVLVNGVALVIPPDLTGAKPGAATTGTAPTASGPRSADGKLVVVPTPLGLAIIGTQTVLWKHSRLNDGHRKLRDCTVANNALAAACVEGTKVLRVTFAGKDGG